MPPVMYDVSDAAIIGALQKVAGPLILELHRRGYDVVVDPDYVGHELHRADPQPLIIRDRRDDEGLRSGRHS